MTGFASKREAASQRFNLRMIEQLICTEGKVYDMRYHCVEPVGENWMDMEIWCLDNFGNPGSIWENLAPEPNQRWYMNNSKFWFKDEKDCILFILRWS